MRLLCLTGSGLCGAATHVEIKHLACNWGISGISMQEIMSWQIHLKARGSCFYHLYPTGRGTVRTHGCRSRGKKLHKKGSADKLPHFTHVISKCSANLASAILVEFSASITLVLCSILVAFWFDWGWGWTGGGSSWWKKVRQKGQEAGEKDTV